mmetsp:Transcript_23072/g.39207  ORF Transcript_23072/g.39207 Transcript_23072/m.39207 type:complete len:105 (-) Transcript_23072:254-568(-)
MKWLLLLALCLADVLAIAIAFSFVAMIGITLSGLTRSCGFGVTEGAITCVIRETKGTLAISETLLAGAKKEPHRHPTFFCILGSERSKSSLIWLCLPFQIFLAY